MIHDNRLALKLHRQVFDHHTLRSLLCFGCFGHRSERIDLAWRIIASDLSLLCSLDLSRDTIADIFVGTVKNALNVL